MTDRLHEQLEATVRSWLVLKDEKRQAMKEFNEALGELEKQIESISGAIESGKYQMRLPLNQVDDQEPPPAVRVHDDVEERLAGHDEVDDADIPRRPVCAICGDQCRWVATEGRWVHMRESGDDITTHPPQFQGYGAEGPSADEIMERLTYWRRIDSEPEVAHEG